MPVTLSVGEIGYRSGLLAAAFTIAFDVVQILQLAGTTGFPLDEILIYGTSLGIVVPFLLMILSLHHLTPRNRQFWTHAALVFAIIYAVFVTSNYVVQLATVIPTQLAGDTATIQVLVQAPHSMFWDYDAIGYIAMGLAALFAVPAFEKVGREKWVRVSLIAHGLVTPLIAIVYFYPVYSHKLLMLGLPWAVTAPLFMLLLARALRGRGNGNA